MKSSLTKILSELTCAGQQGWIADLEFDHHRIRFTLSNVPEAKERDLLAYLKHCLASDNWDCWVESHTVSFTSKGRENETYRAIEIQYRQMEPRINPIKYRQSLTRMIYSEKDFKRNILL